MDIIKGGSGEDWRVGEHLDMTGEDRIEMRRKNIKVIFYIRVFGDQAQTSGSSQTSASRGTKW